ncbi:MAG: peptidoglycan binding domain-containing protein [Candidatus Berkelbacteria bacterium]|nr:peptidoglycan binding domain-containing protein [Candidatus Berkelbacteria bacterium]
MNKQTVSVAHAIELPRIEQIKIPKIFWGVFLFIFVTVSLLFGYQRVYAEKIFPGVKLAGINLSGKTESEAKAILNKKTNGLTNKQIQLTIGNQAIDPKLSDLGVSVDVQKQVDNALLVGHNDNILKSIIDPVLVLFSKRNLLLEVTIQDEKLNQFLAPYEANVKRPQNATLKYENNSFVVVPAKDGFGINREDFKSKLSEQIGNLSFNPISVALAQEKPKINEDATTQAKQEAEKIIQNPLVLTYNDQTFKPDITQLALFIKFEEKEDKLAVALNDQEIDKFLAGIAKKIDIKPVDKQILSTTGQVIDEGKDGQSLDRENAKTQIKSAINSPNKSIALKVVERKKGERTVFPDNVAVAGRFPGKYIDIDLSEQKLYAFDNETLVRSFLISSGLPRTPTPTGTFSIYSRSRAALMTGPGYYLPNVQWVNRFSGSMSIHGTYWHHNFGHPMSHGCVNATNDDAAFIYEWAPMGTPVYIHK